MVLVDNREPSTAEDILRNFRRTFTSFDNVLEKDVRDHLRDVYGTLSAGIMAAALGSAVHLTGVLQANIFMPILSFGFMIALFSSPHSSQNAKRRLGYFLAFAVVSGISTGPLIEYAIAVKPSIVMTAFLSTSIVFTCFTVAALRAHSTKYLHLGGMISSAMLVLLLTAFFSRSAFINGVMLWVGFGINCALVLYDTQMICEKRRCGDTDYVWHAIELFLDFINLLRYLIILLGEKEERSRRNRQQN